MIAARTIGALAASAALGCSSAVSELPECGAEGASHPPPSAECLASPEAAAREAEVDDALEPCRRELRLRVETDPNAGLPSEMVRRDAGRAFRRCIDEAQRRRAELWVFRSFERTPLVFLETERSAPRRTALLDCTDAWTKDEVFDSRTGFARDADATTRCMRELGWEPPASPEVRSAEPDAAER